MKRKIELVECGECDGKGGFYQLDDDGAFIEGSEWDTCVACKGNVWMALEVLPDGSGWRDLPEACHPPKRIQ